ncbi:MAG TPA: hypothetical protein VHB50_12770, partial [Bryobacteraceae bacterium]|nr:hypothetical protein [Bryobacteraceae bacterium]
YLPVTASGASIWLRLRRSGASWTPGWSTDGANFTFADSFLHTMTVATIGPYAGNAGNPQPPPAATSIVDYFRVLGP